MVRAQRGHKPDLLDRRRPGGELLEDRRILALGGLEGGGNRGGATDTATAMSEDTTIRGRNQVKKPPNLCCCRRPPSGIGNSA